MAQFTVIEVGKQADGKRDELLKKLKSFACEYRADVAYSAGIFVAEELLGYEECGAEEDGFLGELADFIRNISGTYDNDLHLA